ncbi:unnamed protein product [Tetraodon nigroviridis]|uniref:(spotted green pufferfish) hypothetical protein n=1 Tax=Tetraodon nigroviridis TaxID=99883 RepID=Q4RK82_TETNG|nr:unnamed protein product [Tetraodon nigroviridis]
MNGCEDHVLIDRNHLLRVWPPPIEAPGTPALTDIQVADHEGGSNRQQMGPECAGSPERRSVLLNQSHSPPKQVPITAGRLAQGPERLELIRKIWTHSGAGTACAPPEPNVRHSSGLGEVNQWGKNNELQVGRRRRRRRDAGWCPRVCEGRCGGSTVK